MRVLISTLLFFVIKFPIFSVLFTHILPLSSFISIQLCIYLLTFHSPITLYLTSHHFNPPSLPPSISLFQLSPILTGKPGGKRRVMKSRSLANRAFEIAMRSMIGTTCSARERGWDSHNHNLALNLKTHTHTLKNHLSLLIITTKYNSDLSITEVICVFGQRYTKTICTSC